MLPSPSTNVKADPGEALITYDKMNGGQTTNITAERRAARDTHNQYTNSATAIPSRKLVTSTVKMRRLLAADAEFNANHLLLHLSLSRVPGIAQTHPPTACYAALKIAEGHGMSTATATPNAALSVEQNMVTTAFTLDGYRIVRNLGLVRGIIVRSRSIFGTIGAGLQTLVGGNITLFTNLCEQTREHALKSCCNTPLNWARTP